jgi:hypothetical protein
MGRLDVHAVSDARPKYRRKADAIERNASQRKDWWRFARSVVLGTVALTLGVLWIGEQYGVEREDILDFLATGVLFVGVLVLGALVFAALVIGLRRLFKK